MPVTKARTELRRDWRRAPLAYWVHKEVPAGSRGPSALYDPAAPQAQGRNGYVFLVVDFGRETLEFSSREQLRHFIEVLSTNPLPTSKKLSALRGAAVGPNGHWLSRLPASLKSVKKRAQLVLALEKLPADVWRDKMTVKSVLAKVTPEAQLRSLIGKFSPKEQQLIRSVRSALRKRLPTANELIYDYRTFFVIGYSPSEQGIESVVSTAARPDGVRLYFTHGPQLPDPKKLLMGSGKQVRYIEVEAASRLKHPDVEALFKAAIAKAGVPLASRGRGRLVTKTSAETQRPRRKPAK